MKCKVKSSRASSGLRVVKVRQVRQYQLVFNPRLHHPPPRSIHVKHSFVKQRWFVLHLAEFMGVLCDLIYMIEIE